MLCRTVAKKKAALDASPELQGNLSQFANATDIPIIGPLG